MSFFARLVFALSFLMPSYGQAATIKKVIKGAQPKLEIYMSRGEVRAYKSGDKVKLNTRGRNFSGTIKAINKQNVLVAIYKGKILLNGLKKGSLVKIKNSSRNSPLAFRSNKSNPYKLSYIAQGSERERLDNSLSLDLEGGVASTAAIPTTGVTLGAYVSHNAIMEFSYSKGVKDLGQVEAIESQLELQNIIEHEAASLRIKYFFGNSFYTNSGVGARRTTVTGHPTLVDELLPIAEGPLFSKSRADAVFDFSIGNKWQMSFFNIGIDWVGLSAPVSKIRLPNNGDKLTDEQESQAMTALVDENSFDDSEYTQEPGTTLSSKIYIGFSF